MFSYTPEDYFLDYSLEFETPDINLQIGKNLMNSPSPKLDFNHYVKNTVRNEITF